MARASFQGSARHSSQVRIYSYAASGPRCWSAVTEGKKYHEADAAQSATRAAVQGGGVLIRKMRPFEEPHAVALVKGHGGLF